MDLRREHVCCDMSVRPARLNQVPRATGSLAVLKCVDSKALLVWITSVTNIMSVMFPPLVP